MTTPRRLYVETSALLAAILDGDAVMRQAIDGAEARVASALTFVEASRGVLRAKHSGSIDAATARELARHIAIVERACDVIAIDEDVLRLARDEFPVEPVRTLDAIHLATIRIVDEQFERIDAVASRDSRVRDNVAALGLALV